jgi:hypothetical protein
MSIPEGSTYLVVMRRLDPRIHHFPRKVSSKMMDCRAQASGSDAVLRTAMPGNDELSYFA